jgi:hypothetical protein
LGGTDDFPHQQEALCSFGGNCQNCCNNLIFLDYDKIYCLATVVLLITQSFAQYFTLARVDKINKKYKIDDFSTYAWLSKGCYQYWDGQKLQWFYTKVEYLAQKA